MQFKKILPKSLFGRMFAIIFIPMLLVQCFTIFFFYERHWDSVTRQMASSLTGEIYYIVDTAGYDFDISSLDDLSIIAKTYFDFQILFLVDQKIDNNIENIPQNYTERAFNEALKQKINYPWMSNITTKEDTIHVDVELKKGILRIFANKKKIFSSTSWLFLGWTLGSSIVMLIIALMFLKGQIRPIRQLAYEARRIGQGKETTDWQLSGAREVRLAGRAFKALKHKINRQLSERTSMLAGVSHDLKTPLTRMKLQLAMMKKSKFKETFGQNISELENMIGEYLSYAKGEAQEKTTSQSIEVILKNIIKKYRNISSKKIYFYSSTKNLPKIHIKLQAIQRVFENIIKNSLDYSNQVKIRVKHRNEQIFIFFDDDGPGIEPEHRIEVLKPFFRLERSRNKSTGGTGLGLAIANDIILSHGGELSLEDSPLGGLRIRLKLPL